MDPDEIIELFSVPTYPNTFQLGCVAERLTIHAQQQRAFNLAWALSRTTGLDNRRNVGVIGAGFSGISFAAAARVMGAEVHLYDNMEDILHLQKGAELRFIQPHIYKWPEPGANYPLTEFPFLNWFSDRACNVVHQVQEQWRRLNIDFAGESHAVQVLDVDNEPNIEFADETLSFDYVVLAVGYGLETTVPGHLRLSYWRNDGLAQPVIDQPSRQTFVVSGTGDGGLIEVLRLKLRDFDHQRFIESFFVRPDFIDAARAAVPFLLESSADTHSWADIQFPQQLLNDIELQIRNDTRVIIVYSGRLSKDASSLLNRVAVAILLHLEAIEIIPGRLIECIPDDGSEIAVVGCNRQEIPATQVVVRHGVSSALRSLINQASFQQILARWNGIDDQSGDPQYPQDFLADLFMPFCGERGYKVVFTRSNSASIDQIYDDLRSTMPNTANFIQLPGGIEEWTWNGSNCRVEWTTLVNSVTVSISFDTNSKALLHRLLHQDRHPYQRLEFRVSTDANEDQWEPITLDGSHTEITMNGIGTERTIVLISTEHDLQFSMLQAHRIFDRDRLLEILRHKWTVERMIDFGWRITAPFTENHNWR